jgi:predicted transcriptional regulator
MDGPVFGYRPRGAGLTKLLGALEADVMDLAWLLDRFTVRDVHERLNSKRPLAYTTVMTTLGRLHQKGLLQREQESNYYVYHPVVTREEFIRRVTGTVLDGLLADFSRPVLSHLVEVIGKTDEAKLRELEEIIRKRRLDGEK